MVMVGYMELCSSLARLLRSLARHTAGIGVSSSVPSYSI